MARFLIIPETLVVGLVKANLKGITLVVRYNTDSSQICQQKEFSMLRLMPKFLITVVALLGLGVSYSTQAQVNNQMIQELFRSQVSSGGVSSNPRPQPARVGEPQQLTTSAPPRIERVCRFEEVESAGGSFDGSSFAPTVIQLYRPNAFESYVKAVTGKELCRFGFQASFGNAAFFEPPPLALVPEDYVLGPGDEVFVRIWGSVEQDFAAVLDRSGNVVIPKVGPVKLAGTTYGQAPKVVRSAVRKMYSDFDVSITLGQLRGIRVYITGFAERPGAITVSNFASLSSVVFASGGPSSSGSFRHVELRRRGQVISQFDLYNLLLRGDKTFDRPLLSEDVIHFGPIGPQVAVFGGVNKPAVFEVKSGETIEDLIRMAGNLSPGSNSSSVMKLDIQERSLGFKSIDAAQLKLSSAQNGDIFLVQNNAQVLVPKDKMIKRIVLQGQVRKPGEYFVGPDTTLSQAVAQAGGLAQDAYLYGTRLSRRSVFEQQNQTMQRILRELDRDLVSQSAISPNSPQEAQALTVRLELGRTMLSRLQSFVPEGRLALPITPTDDRLPEVNLEDGDVVTIPSRPDNVGVFGSVVSAGSFLFDPNKKLGDYLALAGGESKGADAEQIFVIKANGQAKRETGALPFLGRRQNLALAIHPGDTIVVPENMDKTTFTRELVQYTQILYQLGLGAAAIKVLQD